MSASAVMPQLVGDLGTPELLIILVVVVLLFGSSKLPELARGSGRALRIFKAETKGLMDDDDDDAKVKSVAVDPATRIAPPTPVSPASTVPPAATTPVADAGDLEARRRDLAARQAELDAERTRLHGESAAG